MKQRRIVTKIGVGTNLDEAWTDTIRKIDRHLIEGEYADFEIDSYIAPQNGNLIYLYLGASLYKE